MVRGGSKDTKDKKKAAKRAAKSPANKNNPENLEGNAQNSLFGKKRTRTAGEEEGAPEVPAVAPKKKARPEPLREDPAAAALRAAKKQKKAEDEQKKASSGGTKSSGGAKSATTPSSSSAVSYTKPHMEIVEQSNRLWEKLRSDKTPDADRERLVGEVLTLFEGKLLGVLQKHDAARVLQSCFKLGTAAQRDTLMGEIKNDARAIARSHYGHFLLVSILRNGVTAHKQQLLEELRPHAAELLVHAEGSAVLQLLYTDVATTQQRHGMYRALWGKEMELFHQENASSVGNTKREGGPPTTLAQVFESDPLCRPRVLRRLEVLLSKAARKGLAMTSLVQRAAAELLEHGDVAQRAELVASMRDQAVHIMHTRDGARIACGCLRYGDAKDRKAVLKGLKGFAPKAAQDAHGALVLCAALEVVDDTVLLSKGVLAELIADLPTLSQHAHGALPLLQLLAPRVGRYFTPEQLQVLGGGAEPDEGTASKKDPAVRRAELLKALLPALLKHAAQNADELARSPRGSAILFETVRVAAEEAGRAADDDGNAAIVDPAASAAGLATLLAALATVAPSTDGGRAALVADAFGARTMKRLVQANADFAHELQKRLKGELLKWAKAGGGWVVLALLESPRTAASVRSELQGAAGALGKSSAAGCRSLGDVLGKDAHGKGDAAPKKAAKASKKAK